MVEKGEKLKYYTKDWYKEMQVFGFLSFPETKEEWEETIDFYTSEGIDYKENFREDLESRKSDLLRFLPVSFHPYILNGTLNSEYPSKELRKIAEQWQKEYTHRMEKLDEEYLNHYKSIKDKLPKNVVKLHEDSLHDANVKSYNSPSKDTFIMILDCRGGFHYFTDIKLTFTGVKELNLPEGFEGAYWLYDEVYSTKEGFELRVLFDCPFSEVKIKAENVLIETLND